MNRWFNYLTGNLGYHTAHHYKQGLHWSKLPALHDEIVHKIPDECMVKSTFDAFLPDDLVVTDEVSEPEALDHKLAS
jgi:fatty acid desaturase